MEDLAAVSRSRFGTCSRRVAWGVVKTSGGSGLHSSCRSRPGYDFDRRAVCGNCGRACRAWTRLR